MNDEQLEYCIASIREHADRHSKYYGRLLNWPDSKHWHYGIGLSDTHIFDTGRSLLPFVFQEQPKFVVNVDPFTPNQTIERLKYALQVFKRWNYSSSGWNSEHLARLVATDDPISYKVRSFFHEGRHKSAKEHLREHLLVNAPRLVIKSSAGRKPRQPRPSSSFAPEPTVKCAAIPGSTPKKQRSAIEELDRFVGIQSVKTTVRQILNFVTIEKEREDRLGKVSERPTMHMVFAGNPGTGKTEVASVLARIMHEIGYLRANVFIPADRSTLVGQFIGDTEQKTLATCQAALNGVLFIDEAYSLTDNDSPRDFGHMAVSTLLKFMEDNRDRLTVIVAGYAEKMQAFIASNPGLSSRFRLCINFPDFTQEELVQIFVAKVQDKHMIVEDGFDTALTRVITKSKENLGPKFGNARTIRNLFEEAIMRHHDRVGLNENRTDKDLELLKIEDLPEI